MPWFRIDDTFCMHPKAVSAGNASLGLWVRAGSWSAQQLTDGHVPTYMLPALGGKPRDAEALVRAGLWVKQRDGWTFHDWDEYQPTRAETLDKRAKRAAAGRLGGLRSGESRRSKTEANDEASASPMLEANANPRPDPSRPGSQFSSVSPSPSATRAKNRGDGSTPNGTDGYPRHAHHTNADAACRRYHDERRLPLDADELLAWAYRLGKGDPWAGQRVVNECSEQTLEGMNSPVRALRARLRAKVGRETPAATNVIEMGDMFRGIS